jgi:hypothetical protein
MTPEHIQTEQTTVATSYALPAPPPPSTVTVAVQGKQQIGMGSHGPQLNTLEDFARLALCVHQSGMAPKGYSSQQSIIVGMLLGKELGMLPMTSIQNIAIINGRPSLFGDMQLALVRVTGLLVGFEEMETNAETDPFFRALCLNKTESLAQTDRIELAKMQPKLNKTADDFGVTVFVHRRDYSPSFVRFTVADAKSAGLWGKEGPWKQFPARMLKFRARTFALRDQFGDALKGLLSTEEVADIRTAGATPVINLEVQNEG